MLSHFWFNALWLAAVHYSNLYTYSIISYGNIIFDLCPLCWEHNRGIKQGLGVFCKMFVKIFLGITD
jgi:hypothetical protein